MQRNALKRQQYHSCQRHVSIDIVWTYNLLGWNGIIAKRRKRLGSESKLVHSMQEYAHNYLYCMFLSKAISQMQSIVVFYISTGSADIAVVAL